MHTNKETEIQGIRPDLKSGQALWEHACSVISGGTGLLSKRAEMFDVDRWPAYFSKCEGCEVWDLEGNRYIDFVGGVGAILLGYADPDVTAAVQHQLALGTYCTLANPQEVDLADRLLALHPWAGKVRFARGGGEAMAVAVRIARAATGKSGIAFCGYHGWHDWYLAANLAEDDALNGHLIPGLPPKGVPKELSGTAVPFFYNDIASFELAIDKLGGNLAAVVMEPMRTNHPESDFLNKVMSHCRKSGGIFIGDEVTSGFRYGFPGALARMNMEPDIVVYAKALSNGFPFATVIGRSEVMSAAEDSFISSSYWTDAIGPSAACATLDKLERLNVYQNLQDKGIHFITSLRDIAAKYPDCNLSIGGQPTTPTLSFQLNDLTMAAKIYYIRNMLDRGILASTYFYLMMAHENNHIQDFLKAFDEVLSCLAEVINNGSLRGYEISNINKTGFGRLA